MFFTKLSFHDMSLWPTTPAFPTQPKVGKRDLASFEFMLDRT